MLILSPTAAAVLALVAGAWLALAVWATLRGLRRGTGEAGAGLDSREEAALLAVSPAIPLVVLRDGRLEGPDRLAFALGLSRLPVMFGDLIAEARFAEADGERLLDRVTSAAAAAG